MRSRTPLESRAEVPRAEEGLRAEVIADEEGFAALEGEWDALYAACPSATPFQSWAWLFSWWEHYGGPYGLRLVAVREGGGALVGLAPLMLERRRGFGRLLFLGRGRAAYLDVLAVGGREGEVAGAIAGALREMDGWHVADLREVRPTAAAWKLFHGWNDPRVRAWQGYCTVVEAKPWEEVLAGLSKKHRKTVRRTLRSAESEGASWTLARPETAGQAADTLVALNRQQWRDRWQETGPEHWSERFESHIRTAAVRMAASGLGTISELRQDGETILSTFLLFGRDSIGLYMIGAGDEVTEKYSYSALFVKDMMEVASDRDATHIDFLNGEDAYKLRWNPEVVPNQQIILGKNLAYWGPYAGHAVLRAEAVRYAMSEDSPEWARNAANGYVRLRFRVARLVGSKKTPRFVRRITGAWFRWA